MKKLLSVALIVSASVAVDIMPYGVYLDYSSNALKDKGYIVGIYGSYKTLPFKFEIDAEHTNIQYKTTISLDDWKQMDLTLIANYYEGANLAYKAGIHNIWAKQGNDSEYNKVFILGALYYEYLKRNIGIDIYYSDYKGFHVTQFSPKVGFNFGNYNNLEGSFYMETTYNYIHISNNATNKNNYSNFDVKLQNFKGPWTTTLNASFGKSAYKVANGGFVVYNLEEEYKYSYGASLNYSLDKTDNIKVEFTKSRYTNTNNDDVDSNVYSVSYLKTF